MKCLRIPALTYNGRQRMRSVRKWHFYMSRRWKCVWSLNRLNDGRNDVVYEIINANMRAVEKREISTERFRRGSGTFSEGFDFKVSNLACVFCMRFCNFSTFFASFYQSPILFRSLHFTDSVFTVYNWMACDFSEISVDFRKRAAACRCLLSSFRFYLHSPWHFLFSLWTSGAAA